LLNDLHSFTHTKALEIKLASSHHKKRYSIQTGKKEIIAIVGRYRVIDNIFKD